MTDDMTQAATRLADVLTRENDALRRSDYAAAGTLAADKEAGMAALSRAAVAGPGHDPALAILGRSLRDLAADNQTLLQRAIEVQTRIVLIVARAAAPALAERPYTVNGGRPQPDRVAGLALSARA